MTQGTTVANVNLTFTSTNAGTFSYTQTNPAQSGNGTFTLTAGNGGTTGGTTSGTDGGTQGITTSLSGKRIQLQTLTGGFAGQELLTFTTSNGTTGTFRSDAGDNLTGTFVYTPKASNHTATLNLTYNNGDHSELTLTFNSNLYGSFAGPQTINETRYDTTGNFGVINQ